MSNVEGTEDLKDGHKAQEVADGQSCAGLGCGLPLWLAPSKQTETTAGGKREDPTDPFERC